MGHEVLSNHFVAIFAFPASSVGFQLLFLNIFVNNVTIMHGDRLYINLFIFGKNKSLGVDVPPISSLIFDKVTD